VADSYDPEEADPKRLKIAVDSQLQMADYRRVGIPASGMKADPGAAARTYLRIASNYGHPAAMYALGEMNMVGEGVKQNPQQGLKWYTAAARKRHSKAQAALGDLYWAGRAVKKNETRALMWYILAMETTKPEESPEIVNRYNFSMMKPVWKPKPVPASGPNSFQLILQIKLVVCWAVLRHKHQQPEV
jgi:uncharacterized protein